MAVIPYIDKKAFLRALTGYIQQENNIMARATDHASMLYIVADCMFDAFTEIKANIIAGKFDPTI